MKRRLNTRGAGRTSTVLVVVLLGAFVLAACQLNIVTTGGTGNTGNTGGNTGNTGGSGGATSWACVTSDQDGDCPFSPDSQITDTQASGSTFSDPYVDQDVWSPISGWSQTLSANSPQDWQVVANEPAGNDGVVAYPNTGIDLSGAVDGYNETVSSFSESMPHNDQTSAWAMYDLWFNNWADEVMIQYDFTNNGDCTPVATAQFGGSYGVPVQTWHLCDFSGGGTDTLAWKLGAGEGSEKQSESSGSVDLKAMIEWLENNGYLPAGSTWTAISDGWEICSTGGQNETFQVSNYSVTAN